LEERVRKVFVDVLSLAPGANGTGLVYNESQGWDSIGHMRLVAALEDEFDCMLEMEDILDMSSYDKAVAIMAKYG
jgi:acyl carrier protein